MFIYKLLAITNKRSISLINTIEHAVAYNNVGEDNFSKNDIDKITVNKLNNQFNC